MESRIATIEQIVGREVGRGIRRLVKLSAGSLFKAATNLSRYSAPRVAICTGFYIPQAEAPETDGPVGAALLAAGMAENNVPVTIVTDHFCRGVVSAAVQEATSMHQKIEIYDSDHATSDFTHFISIERPGPSTDGRVYNMSGMDITDTTPALHSLYSGGRWCKIGIGDGGNEIGMGTLPREVISQDIQYGHKIACVTLCDFLIVCGVSNWGAWGLLAALKLLRPDWKIAPFLRSDLAYRILLRCVEAGAVDGVTALKQPTVDGHSWEMHQNVLEEILTVCKGTE